MIVSVTSTQNTSIASPVVVLLLIGASTIFSFGFAVAVVKRANSDYKKTKAGLPGMRKDFWRLWWKAVKVGFAIAIVAVFLMVWAVRDIRGSNLAPAAPASTSPTPRITDRWIK